jgi:hypothetical protein
MYRYENYQDICVFGEIVLWLVRFDDTPDAFGEFGHAR